MDDAFGVIEAVDAKYQFETGVDCLRVRTLRHLLKLLEGHTDGECLAQTTEHVLDYSTFIRMVLFRLQTFIVTYPRCIIINLLHFSPISRTLRSYISPKNKMVS